MTCTCALCVVGAPTEVRLDAHSLCCSCSAHCVIRRCSAQHADSAQYRIAVCIPMARCWRTVCCIPLCSIRYVAWLLHSALAVAVLFHSAPTPLSSSPLSLTLSSFPLSKGADILSRLPMGVAAAPWLTSSHSALALCLRDTSALWTSGCTFMLPPLLLLSPRCTSAATAGYKTASLLVASYGTWSAVHPLFLFFALYSDQQFVQRCSPFPCSSDLSISDRALFLLSFFFSFSFADLVSSVAIGPQNHFVMDGLFPFSDSIIPSVWVGMAEVALSPSDLFVW